MSEFRAKLNPFTGQLQLVPTNIVLAFKAAVATQASLPLTGNAKGDARLANDTGHLYVWSIEASSGLLTDWVDAGDIVDIDWSVITNKPTSAVADIDDAVSKRHTQNSDTYLAQGTGNEVTAANAKDAVDKKHTQGTDQSLDTGGANEVSAAQAKAGYTHSGVTGNPHDTQASEIDTTESGKSVQDKIDEFDASEHTHANKVTLDAIQEALTTVLKAAYDDAVIKAHTHTNKATLDLIQEAFTTALKNAYDAAVILAHDQNTDYVLKLNLSGLPDLINNGTLKSNLSVDALITIDGRDLSVDGGKLDGIEAGAVALATVKADGDIADAIATKHSHSNKATLDSIQEALTTALKGNYDTAYSHSQVTSGNPHNVTKSDIGLGNVTNDLQIKDAIDTYTEKTTPIDADLTVIQDSEVSGTPIKKLSWANIKTTLKTYFDTIYQAALGFTAVPDTRQVNGHALSTDVEVVASEVPTDASGVSVQDHIDNTLNPHSVTKAQVGLTNVTDDAQVKASQLKRGTFVNGDLSTGKLTITHNLGLAAPYTVIVVIFDNNSKQIIPDDVTGATNSTEIDLTSYGTLTGTWGYLLLG